MFNKITVLIYCCFFLSACFSGNDSSFDIDFSADSSKIVISGVEEANLYQLKKNLNNDSLSSKFVTVMEIAANASAADQPLAGKLVVNGNLVYFKPEQAFIKGRNYWVSTVLNTSFATKAAVFKADVGHAVKPQEKILRR